MPGPSGANLDPRFPDTLSAALSWVASIPVRYRLPADLVAHLAGVAGDLAEAVASEPFFVPVAIPLALAGDHVVPVAAACTALHLAALEPGTPAAQVWIAAAQEFLCELPGEEAAAASRVAAAASAVMAGGAAGRVAPAGATGPAGLETELVGCFAQLAGIGAGHSPEECEALRAWGHSVGAGRGGDAVRLLASLWLPWGARPILEEVALRGFAPANRRIRPGAPEGTKPV